jgi:hypothetical protein
MHAHSLTRAMRNSMIQHLARRIRILDLISRQSLKQEIRILSKVDWRHEVSGCAEENAHQTSMYEAQTNCTAYTSEYGSCTCHLARLLLDLA